MSKQEEFLTIDETAKRLKLAKITIYRMARRGDLPALKLGKSWRISSLKLSELFEKNMKKSK